MTRILLTPQRPRRCKYDGTLFTYDNTTGIGTEAGFEAFVRLVLFSSTNASTFASAPELCRQDRQRDYPLTRVRTINSRQSTSRLQLYMATIVQSARLFFLGKIEDKRGAYSFRSYSYVRIPPDTTITCSEQALPNLSLVHSFDVRYSVFETGNMRDYLTRFAVTPNLNGRGDFE
ncbi:hypothetical protein K488DRAFT_88737 [Vararia minispora EC-137]|uniref:Uncharacterized protein n=1 Tax=Vararia minispora EC-137 TaxID=1314806 RepID=A0ACB8QCC2_9AGAM|nr:hypothetical protein K488DRAFT_88737 [Vararia minispora EC-137]